MRVKDPRTGAATIFGKDQKWALEARSGRPSSRPSFDDRFRKLTAAAADTIDTSTAFVAALDRNARPLEALHASQRRDHAAEHMVDLHHLAAGGKLVINDLTEDDRTLSLPCVTDDPHLRFYAGAPIIVGGRAVGTLAVVDRHPRPNGIGLLESAALSGFAACASLLWDAPDTGLPQSWTW